MAGVLSALGFVVVDVDRASLAERIALLRGAWVVVAAQTDAAGGGALRRLVIGIIRFFDDRLRFVFFEDLAFALFEQCT